MAEHDGAGGGYYRLATAFEWQLHTPIREGLVVAGRFLRPSWRRRASDALLPARAPPPALCLACATSGQRVIVHNNNSHAAAARRSTRHSATAAAHDNNNNNNNNDDVTGVGETAWQTLTFSHELTALAAGALRHTRSNNDDADDGDDDDDATDVLLLGAARSVFAYDVHHNKQLFHKSVDDGVRALVCGPVKTTAATTATPSPGAYNDNSSARTHDDEATATACPVLAMVGGNCAVYGLDAYGTERYWTVTGEQVSALAMLPWHAHAAASSTSSTSSSLPLAVVAASDDCEIRVFDGEEVVASIVEVARVRQLVPAWRATTSAVRSRRRHHHNSSSTTSHDNDEASATARGASAGRFAYLLDNGTVGVYAHGERVWRIKGRSTPVAAAFCDVDGDGIDELVVGWRSGRIEVRSDTIDSGGGGGGGGGGVLYRDMASAPIAAVLAEDYRGDGCRMPLICTVDGTVRGLSPLHRHDDDGDMVSSPSSLSSPAVAAVAAQARVRAAMAVLDDERTRLQAQLTRLQAQAQPRAAMPDADAHVTYTCTPNVHTRKLDVVLQLQCDEDDNDDDDDDDDDKDSDDNRRRRTTPARRLQRSVIQGCVLRCGDGGALGADVEAVCVHADTPTPQLTCSLDWPHNAAATLHARVAVGLPSAPHHRVHLLAVSVPAFVMYASPRTLVQQCQFSGTLEVLSGTVPSGSATLRFAAPLRIDALARWLRGCFVVTDDELRPRRASAYACDDDDVNNGHDAATLLRVELLHVRDGGYVVIEARNDHNNNNDNSSSRSSGSTLAVHAETMAVCGDVLSALAHDLASGHSAFATHDDKRNSSSVTDATTRGTSAHTDDDDDNAGDVGGLARLLAVAQDTTATDAVTTATTTPSRASLLVDVTCEFAHELQQLREALQRIRALDAVRVKLTTDMADAATSLKALHAYADDARLLGDTAALRSAYTRILELNRELLGEEAKRRAHDAEQQAVLKDVHTLLYHASRVRLCGRAREAFLSASRAALREDAHAKLVELVRHSIV